MTEPGFYPHGPAKVELRQTHISYVFLAGEYVYKVKKPVRFAFLDYSTLEKRRHFCGEELRLNRRLAPKIYLDVVPIGRDGSRFVPEAAHLRAVEYAVKMLCLPEERMLNRLLSEGRAGREDIRAIVEKLAAFHRSADSAKAAVYGAPEAVRRQIDENFEETRSFIGRTISEKMFHRIRDYSLGFLSAQIGLLEARVRDGRIKDGHGDLRAEHICMTEDLPIFDCIEFNESFRTCDVASEIGFLAMDLDFLNAGDLSRYLAAEYARAVGDDALATLLSLYQCYRAYVRGKVESLKSQEREVPETERERVSTAARRYFFLADRYARGVPRAALLIVYGLAGSGKSTVARMLGDLTGFEILSSDVVRKRLARIQPTERAGKGYREGIYSASFTQRTYETLLKEAEKRLNDGRGLIVDATFNNAEHRRLFLHSAAGMGIRVAFIECRAGEEEIFRRLQKRAERNDDISDATWEVYLRQRKEFTPLAEIPDRLHVTIDTESRLGDSIEEFVESL
ncbi:MAG: AAA family ATPase [Candidatus Binatia bacterium]